MRIAVVSDFHLGTLAGTDMARRPEAFERLVAGLQGADRIVVIGDLLELRERPVAGLLEAVRPFFERLAGALAGRHLTIVPGNHDHALAEPWLARRRLQGEPLGAEQEWPADADGPAGVIASWLPRCEVTVAYPGLTLAPGVYATHGHYLDLLLTVPRLESIAASAMARFAGRRGRASSAADFEAILAPFYSLYGGLAEGASGPALERGATLSRSVWSRVTGDGIASLLLGKVTIPAAVATLNRLGIGPFRPEISADELRRAGLLAMGPVADSLAPGAQHVVFGHTHRPGPLPGDDGAEWTSPSGTKLVNSGNWNLERTFVGDRAEQSPYWPGTIVRVDAGAAPRLENALLGYSSA